MKRLGIVASFSLSLVASSAKAEEYGAGDPAQEPLAAQPPLSSPAPLDEEAPAEDRYYDGYYDGYAAALAADHYDDGYDPQAYEEFEDELAPHGSWVEVPSYGHVWQPSAQVVGVDFAPYATGGHFTYTDYGWTWLSDYSWGWAPFHYGRWVDLVAYGWCWVPGTVWGPAWVDWRVGGGYVGWAPLPPRGVVVGPPTVRRSSGGVVVGPPSGMRSGGVVVGPPPAAKSPRWSFVLEHQMGVPRPSLVASHVVPKILPRTRVVNETRSITAGSGVVRFNAGPVLSGFGGSSPVALQSIAPRLLPRPGIAPRLGAPLSARPWVRERPVGPRVTPLGPPAAVPRSIPIGPPRIVPSGPASSLPNYFAPQQTAPIARPLRREPVFSVTLSDGRPAGVPTSVPSYAPPPSRSFAPSAVAPSWHPSPSSGWAPTHGYQPSSPVISPSHGFASHAPVFSPHAVAPPSPPMRFQAPPTHVAPTPSAVRPSFSPSHPAVHAAPAFRGRGL